MSTICIYHGNCADGFGSAWAVRQATIHGHMEARGYSDGMPEFIGAGYQNPPPDVTDRDVIMVDFSYKRPVLLEMAERASSILILDHHTTAEQDLVNLPGNCHTVFDMQRSGARIAWDFFMEGQTPPPLILHIEDRDLWRFALPFTREIQANVFSHPYDFAVWDDLMAADPHVLAAEGRAIERKHMKDIRELVHGMKRRIIIAGYEVWAANLPYVFTSDAGHIMAEGEPFAACYWDTPEGRTYSLRSRDDGLDVSEIAKRYGGGGHRNASGFRLPHGVTP